MQAKQQIIFFYLLLFLTLPIAFNYLCFLAPTCTFYLVQGSVQVFFFWAWSVSIVVITYLDWETWEIVYQERLLWIHFAWLILISVGEFVSVFNVLPWFSCPGRNDLILLGLSVHLFLLVVQMVFQLQYWFC